jgi:hypothetical protein
MGVPLGVDGFGPTDTSYTNRSPTASKIAGESLCPITKKRRTSGLVIGHWGLGHSLVIGIWALEILSGLTS